MIFALKRDWWWVAGLCLLGWGVGAAAQPPCPAPATRGLCLHVPSPDWRDQILYFVMTDRFDDGNPRNNDQGAGEFNPQSGAAYSGGDLAGVARRLDYIRGLGATGVWITPPVANQWWDLLAQYGGYHGYWASHFGKVDAHLGTLADYQRLSDALHRQGMVLVQDVVLNHVGNYFRYTGPWDPAHPERNFTTIAQLRGPSAPAQWPFSQNDARIPAQRKAAIYHWTPDITDYADPRQEHDFQMSGLDDLNSENPVVRRALRQSYAHWVRAVGVDGFRLDTAFYVPPAAVQDFLYATDARAPGMAQVARATGRRDFFMFGEGFGIDKPYADKEARKIESYVKAPNGAPVMQGMLNFPLYGSIGDVMARGRPTAELGWRIRNLMQVHADPHRMVSFVDNHDVDRFLAGGDTVALEHSLLLMLTLPGVPVIYYGTEQGFAGQRDAMFKGGFHSGGMDHFDTTAPLYRRIADMTALRRSHPVLSRGVPTVLRDSAVGPGVLAYRMDGTEGQALVVFNTAIAETLVDGLGVGWPAGTALQPLYGLGGAAPEAVVDGQGRVSLRLPPRSAFVFVAGKPAAAASAALPAPTLEGLEPVPGVVRWRARGRAAAGVIIQLAVDGRLDASLVTQTDAQGHWQLDFAVDDMVEPDLDHRVVAWQPQAGVASDARTFTVAPDWQLRADVDDPPGDDVGPTGNYRYPLDAGWQEAHPADIRHVRVWTAGGSLRIAVQLNQLMAQWNPVLGFDHVALTAFLELSDRPGGATAMPQQNADLPQGMRWHYRLRVHGWSNALFASEGADAEREGTPVAPAAHVAVDRANQTLILTLKAGALGWPTRWEGARLLLTSWDYDGGYRVLQPQAGPGRFGGGTATDAKWMDATEVITLR